MTISPLMVEIFFSLNWYDGPATAANSPPGHFYCEDVWGCTPPPPSPQSMRACGVDHQSKRTDMKIKSTFNISFQIHFVCFVLKKKSIVSWILLVVAFNLLTPWCSFLQKGRLMKLCDGDCTIKTKQKKEIGSDVSFSSVFLKAMMLRGFCCLCAPGSLQAGSDFPNTVSTVCPGENEVTHEMKCGNYTMGAYLTC